MFLKNALSLSLSLSLSLFQEVGLGAKTSAFHQKQQVAGSIPGVNLSKKIKGVRLPTNHDSKTLQNGSFVHWVWPLRNTKFKVQTNINHLISKEFQ